MLMMKAPYTKSGKCGDTVWQNARYGQICYLAFIPANPRTPAQVAVRGTFGAVSARWRTLTEEQRLIWNAVARTVLSRSRLGRGPLTGYNLFVKINVRLANRGCPQVDLPPVSRGFPQPADVSLFHTSRFDQPPIAATLFLQANRLLAGCQRAPRPFAALAPPPT
jgi:hypothetical protein